MNIVLDTAHTLQLHEHSMPDRATKITLSQKRARNKIQAFQLYFFLFVFGFAPLLLKQWRSGNCW